MQYISEILLKHAQHIDKDPWRGLPELTNSSEYILRHGLQYADTLD
jgi:glycogen debranching enzyme